MPRLIAFVPSAVACAALTPGGRQSFSALTIHRRNEQQPGTFAHPLRLQGRNRKLSNSDGNLANPGRRDQLSSTKMMWKFP
jgi:hypothetical protein